MIDTNTPLISGVLAAGGHLGGPDWTIPTYTASPTVAPVPRPQNTVTQNTGDAISAGQAAYNQLPGYAGDITQLGGTISSELSGQLPANVVQQIQQASAERGVSTGSPGSPNSNASYLQSLGLNSLQLQQTGQANLNAATQNLPGGAISQNPGFYTTPNLVQQAASQNAQNQTDANASAAGLQAAQAGVRAAGVGGPHVVGGLPPTPGDTATTNSGPSYYAPPVVGWGGGGTVADTTGATGSNMDTLDQILNEYSNTVNPNSDTSGGGTATTTTTGTEIGTPGQAGYFYAGPNVDTAATDDSSQ